MSNKRRVLVAAVAVIIFACAQCVWAVDGFWSPNAANPGDWSDAANWNLATIADGDGSTAFFWGDLPTGALIQVNVDAARAGQLVGNLNFSDSDSSTPGSWIIQGTTTMNLQNTVSGTSSISVTPVFDPLGAELVAAEISAPVTVTSGTSLSITGAGGASGGTLKLSGNTTVIQGDTTIAGSSTVVVTGSVTLNNGNASISGTSKVNVAGTVSLTNGNTTIDNSSTVNVSGNLSTLTTTAFDPTGTVEPTTGQVTLTGGSTINLSGSGILKSGYNSYIGELGSDGTLNVGLLPADSATATFNSGLYVGGGTTAATGTINVHGTSTLSTTGGWNEIQIGCWGIGSGVLNVYDSAVVTTPALRVGHNDSCNGTINVYNSGKLITTNSCYIGDNTDPTVAGDGGTINLYNSSQLNATGDVVVGADGNGTLNVKDDSTVTITGALRTSAWGYWTEVTPGVWGVTAENTGIVTIGGSDRVALQAGSISMEGVWLYSGTGHCTGTINVTDSAEIKTTGDCSVGRWNNTVSTLNLDTSAKATIGGQLIIGQADAAEGYVNVSGNAQLIAGGIQVSGGAADWYTGWQTRQLNISGSALVASTGDTSVGNTSATGGFVTIADNGQLKVGGNLIMGVSGPSWQSSIKNTGTKSTLVVGNLNLNAGSIYVPGVTSNGTGVAGGIDVLGTLKFNGGWLVATTASTDFIKPAILVQSGGAKIDPNWNNLAITQALAQDPTSTGGGLELGNGYLKLTGALTYTGATTIDNQFSTLEIDSPGNTVLAAISGPGTLAIGDGVAGNTVIATSVSVGTLTISTGSTLTISAIPGGPIAGGGLTAVPEPSTIATAGDSRPWFDGGGMASAKIVKNKADRRRGVKPRAGPAIVLLVHTTPGVGTGRIIKKTFPKKSWEGKEKNRPKKRFFALREFCTASK